MPAQTKSARGGLNAAVAAEIRAEQGRLKLSSPALAERAGVPYGSLRRYLSAERSIDMVVLEAVAAALATTASALIAEAERNLARTVADEPR